MRKIDVHIHGCADHPDCIDRLDRLELELFNICVAHGLPAATLEKFYRANAARWYPGL